MTACNPHETKTHFYCDKCDFVTEREWFTELREDSIDCDDCYAFEIKDGNGKCVDKDVEATYGECYSYIPEDVYKEMREIE